MSERMSGEPGRQTTPERHSPSGDTLPASDSATRVMPVAGGPPPGGDGHDGPNGSGGGGDGDSGVERPRRKRRRWLRRVLWSTLVLFLVLIGGAALLYALTPIPSSAQSAAISQGSIFYYGDGKTPIAKVGVNRSPVPITAVPKYVQYAVVAAENRSFYTDPGVSVKGTLRALWSTVTGQGVQGGSTITQQMVRNYYSGLSQERSVWRKMKEIMISLKVDREKSKDFILGQYLNTIYFGRGAYGIQAAAEAYYRVPVQQLTPSQGAYLAAVIQQPTYLSYPTGDRRQAAVNRWQYVVNGMVQLKAITPQQASTMTFPDPVSHNISLDMSGTKGYVITLVQSELKRLGYDQAAVERGGLTVVTTLDKGLMAHAKAAVEDNLPDGTPAATRAGLVAIDPATGEVRAFYGGSDYLTDQYDSAFTAQHQAGSAFKPFALGAALNSGVQLSDTFDGSSPQNIDGTVFHNDSNENFGQVNLVTMTAQSINTAYINLTKQLGVAQVAKTAEAMGIPPAQLSHNLDLTMTLGSADVSVAQMAGGYATFASGGTFHAPHLIRSVTDLNGHRRLPSTTGTPVINNQAAADATFAMTRVINNGTGTAASLGNRPAAGKTGTTTDSKSIWFCGFTPQLVAAVNIYRTDNHTVTIPGYSSYGGSAPATIWRTFMQHAMDGQPIQDFPPPSEYVGSFVPASPSPTPSTSATAPTSPSPLIPPLFPTAVPSEPAAPSRHPNALLPPGSP